jgi:Uma2 family endonuclease
MTFSPMQSVANELDDLIVYPESDGKPMADNTLQFRWIVMLQGGLDAVFKARNDVFVAGDLFWYPVKGQPKIVTAPDTLVVFGRPKGDRGSYLQWKEGGIAPQVVFEVLSPGNSVAEMERKRGFYEQYGVEEYYLYDPDAGVLEGWLRRGRQLVALKPIEGWVSPRLGIRFEPGEHPGDEWRVYGPDGRVFVSYVEVIEQRNQAEWQAKREWLRAEQERFQREQAEQRASQAAEQAEEERLQRTQAEQQIEQERLQRTQAEQQIEQERLQREKAEERASQAAEQVRQAVEQVEQERLRVAQLKARLKELLGELPDE